MEEKNKLIDSFMGSKRFWGEYIPNSYHTNWGFLMPVIEKIQHLDNEHDICVDFKIELMGAVELWINKKRVFAMTAFEEGTLINAVHEGVITFINWHNENKQ